MAGRGVHRGVYSSLLDHPEFQALSPPARHVFLTLRISKQAGPAAIFICYREVVAQQTGLKVREVERALYELEKQNWLRLEGRIVWIVNGLRHDPTMRLANPKHRIAVLRALEELPSTEIVTSYCKYYNLEWLSDRLSIGYPKLDSPNTEYRIPKNTEILLRVPSNSREALAVAPTNGIVFHIPASVSEALRRAPVLGQVARFGDPSWWQAQLRANPGVDLGAEVLKAEAWMQSNPSRAPRKAFERFLHTWLARADRST